MIAEEEEIVWKIVSVNYDVIDNNIGRKNMFYGSRQSKEDAGQVIHYFLCV